MKICVLTTSYPRFAGDDAGIFLQRLVQALSVRGVEGEVHVPLDAHEPQVEAQGSFTLKRFRYGLFNKGQLAFGAGIIPNVKSKPWLLLQAPLLLLQFARSALSSRTLTHCNWIATGVAAWLAYLISRQPYIITLRGEDVRLLKSIWGRLLLYFPIKHARAITSVNKSFLDDVERLYAVPRDRLVFIPNGVDLPVVTPEQRDAFRQRKNLDSQHCYLLFVGTIIPRKRIEILIELLAQEELRDCELLLCGRIDNTPYFENVKKRAQRLGCSDRVRFEGMVSPTEVPLYLACSNFYVSASNFEGRPNSLIEAMATGKLVFVSNIPAHAEIIVHGQNGLLFDTQNLKVAALELARYRQNVSLQMPLERAAQDFARAFTWENCAEEFLKLFQKVTSR